MMRYPKKTFLLAVALLLLALLCVVATTRSKIFAPTFGKQRSYPLVGTWENQSGSIFRFQPDGSLRVRWVDDKAEEPSYHKFRLDGDKLSIMYVSKSNDYFSRIRQAVFGTSSETFRVMTISEEKLELVDNRRGIKAIFKRCQDESLDDAP